MKRTGNPQSPFPPWTPLAAEFVGTGLLVAVGPSIVILDFGHGRPLLELLPYDAGRRLVTGVHFGRTGALTRRRPSGKRAARTIPMGYSTSPCKELT